MAPVGIYDELEFQSIPSGINIACQGLSIPDKDNIVYKAARAFYAKVNAANGVSVRIVKNIPVAAGLGGGSSDAAATLKALNMIYSQPLSSYELDEMALHLGADVPFFLRGVPCIAKGIGEILEPINKKLEYWYVIVTPPVHISTSWVYARVKLKLTLKEDESIINRLKKSGFNIVSVLENDLEEVTIGCVPSIKAIKKKLIEAGAEGSLMSGSGPSVFGIFEFKDDALKASKSLTLQSYGNVLVGVGL
jgi:4-diphosphocytidyl-2-C-methyl-D-erythritol kinase